VVEGLIREKGKELCSKMDKKNRNHKERMELTEVDGFAKEPNKNP
jgi:hypothetical protein